MSKSRLVPDGRLPRERISARTRWTFAVRSAHLSPRLECQGGCFLSQIATFRIIPATLNCMSTGLLLCELFGAK
jgi:hypothetical protein